jgi:hypothetical protein
MFWYEPLQSRMVYAFYKLLSETSTCDKLRLRGKWSLFDLIMFSLIGVLVYKVKFKTFNALVVEKILCYIA